MSEAVSRMFETCLPGTSMSSGAPFRANLCTHLFNPDGVHYMLKVRVCGAHMIWFCPKNSLNKCHFSVYFPKKMCLDWLKLEKSQLEIGSFPSKFIIKVVMQADFCK